MLKSYGLAVLPGFLNNTRGRTEVKELTGQNMVPVLVTEDGEVVRESRQIEAWAKAHPAGAAK